MQKAIKSILLLLFLNGVILQSHGQVTRLYAFSQDINGGAFLDPVIQKKLAEQGMKSTRSRQFIYAEIKKGVPILVTQLWIDRKGYNCHSTPPVSCPVILPSADRLVFPDDTLIRSTTGEIIQLDFQESKAPGINNTVRKLIASNAIVLEYKIKGKTYYASAKHFRQLHPLNTP